MKSLAGVAANTRPFAVTRSPGAVTAISAVLPAFATDPSAFSTTLASPPRLLPGVGLALGQRRRERGIRRTIASRESNPNRPAESRPAVSADERRREPR